MKNLKDYINEDIEIFEAAKKPITINDLCYRIDGNDLKSKYCVSFNNKWDDKGTNFAAYKKLTGNNKFKASVSDKFLEDVFKANGAKEYSHGGPNDYKIDTVSKPSHEYICGIIGETLVATSKSGFKKYVVSDEFEHALEAAISEFIPLNAPIKINNVAFKHIGIIKSLAGSNRDGWGFELQIVAFGSNFRQITLFHDTWYLR